MTRAPTRTHFHSSRLIRILSDLALADAVDPGMAFAEKLGQWVDYSDAISLSAALTASATSATSPPAMLTKAQMNARMDAADAFARVRETLVASITKSGQPNLSSKRAELPAAEPGMPFDMAISYEPYRRRYLALQRDMDVAIRPLRTQVREALARASPTLKALAALDAALDGILCEREGKLLATVPVLLNKRFTQLLKVHPQAKVATQADNPTLWLRPGGWLARFGHEFQTVLLAELDVRLQPTVGLMEALNDKMTTQR